MALLGILLVLVAAAFATGVLVDQTDTTTITIFDRAYQVTNAELFLAGAACATVLLLGLALIMVGARRSAAKRRQLRAVRAQAGERVATLEEEKRTLERKLAESPSADGSSPAPQTRPEAMTVKDRLVARGRRRKTPEEPHTPA
ncbi:hypothetical protein [Bailinhaonella thermotolerans]|uniref:Lipopolysaccharide assembly protein A domain-containing protein n=1 Tax=Bailinhaonella thermotolerans TaxID=1070861 RepID=A0A3A4A569_9ACTN|nr:hypothetical protein [Bailinhaonella thermotolerans]RJL20403.1 hypothetical protein D5H75_39635 [Bailinhaonella thermotolerans]